MSGERMVTPLDLKPGDRVMRFDDRPNFNVYRGVVRTVSTMADGRILIDYEDGHIIVDAYVLVGVAT